MSGTTRPIPVPTLRRMPAYHNRLLQAQQAGLQTLSCSVIANDLSLTDTQVRKDLALTGVTGTPRVGYPVRETIDAIATFLGWNNCSNAFLVGAGSLGTSIMGYRGYAEHGLDIIAAFDANPDRVGSTIHGQTVLPMSKLPGLVRRMNVRIAVLTVPGENAQQVATELVASGIQAIWNFTPASLNLGAQVVVEDVRLYGSLASLTARLHALLAN